MENPIGDVELAGLPLHKKGKVRNVYEVGDKLLIVATDRI
ncbi:MAG TPA: phosphoribosylaminoimidazolesuccinocarboxamide synthase, partial [Candidatus Aminicenantes bacterium]|nr:phosphoribosylaminoimidazolesuccinocarboxamide synthase [Candidatus Aminicenantes bacterium]